MMTAQPHTQGHTGDGLRGRADDDVVQQDAVAARFGLADQRDLSFAAERGLDGKAGLCFNERARLLQQQASRPERAQRGIKRREPTCHLIRIQEAHQAQSREQLPRECGFPRTIAAAKNAESRVHGANQ